MAFLSTLQQVPDTLKVGASTGPVVMNVAGYSVEQWMAVGSIVVSLMFIIEKLPMMITRIRQLIKWIKSAKREK